MATYYFFLGNTPSLSRLELESLGLSPLIALSDSLVAYTGGADVMGLAPKLGGVRKIAQLLETCTPGDAVSHVTDILTADPTKNVAITDYTGHDVIPSISLLKSSISVSRPIRFVSMETTEHELLMLSHQHVLELNLISDPGSSPGYSDPGSEVAIAKTVWIFDAEDWVRRDREKPYRDIKRGMLPPKLARILVNIGTRGRPGLTVYDPFCGTGTVLAEALLVGCQAFGSDNNSDAIAGARKNLTWLCTTYHLDSSIYHLAISDVSRPPFPQASVVITEPYMGPLQDSRALPSAEKIKDIARGLDKLYRGAFRAWGRLLPPGGRVVMTIPSFQVAGRVLPSISVDTISGLGYNFIASVPYGKPGSVVIRNITVLEKQ